MGEEAELAKLRILMLFLDAFPSCCCRHLGSLAAMTKYHHVDDPEQVIGQDEKTRSICFFVTRLSSN
jgi:hypothetical protein